jgi:hypothetical protein
MDSLTLIFKNLLNTSIVSSIMLFLNDEQWEN